MKNILKISVFFLVVFILSGCAILRPKTMKPVYPQPMKKTAPNYDATLSFAYNRFTLKINNKSAKSLNVVWDDSAIVENGVSHSLVPTGTQYIKANESKTNLIVPAGLEVNAVFSSANNVYYNEALHQWIEYPITAGLYVLSIAIKNGEKQENVDYKFTVTEKVVDESEMYEEEIIE